MCVCVPIMTLSKTYDRLVGFTTTPFRLDGQGLVVGFDKLIESPSVTESIDAGYLVPPQSFMENLINTTNISMARGDFITGELSRAARKATHSIVSACLKIAMVPCPRGGKMELRKFFFFAVDVNHSLHLRDALRNAGVEAEHLDGSTSETDRRFRQTDASGSKQVQVLTNCMIATEGFDVLLCSAEVLARPTKSLGLFIQMVGRGLRTAPGKTDCILLDCGGLVDEHGLPSDPLKYTLEDGLVPRDTEQENDSLETRTVHSDLDSVLRLREMKQFLYLQLKITRKTAREVPVAKL